MQKHRGIISYLYLKNLEGYALNVTLDMLLKLRVHMF